MLSSHAVILNFIAIKYRVCRDSQICHPTIHRLHHPSSQGIYRSIPWSHRTSDHRLVGLQMEDISLSFYCHPRPDLGTSRWSPRACRPPTLLLPSPPATWPVSQSQIWPVSIAGRWNHSPPGSEHSPTCHSFLYNVSWKKIQEFRLNYFNCQSFHGTDLLNV